MQGELVSLGGRRPDDGEVSDGHRYQLHHGRVPDDATADEEGEVLAYESEAVIGISRDV